MIWPMPQAQDGMPGAPSRRAALRALGLVAAVVPLAACGIRLEDDAPRVPLVPTREPIPGEAFLLSLWLGSGDLAAQAAGLGGAATSIAGQLRALHQEQASALVALLRRLGVPEKVRSDAESAHRRAEAAETSTPTTGASPPATPAVPAGGRPTTGGAPARETPAALAEAEARALSQEAFAGLAALTREAVPVAAASLAQRAAAARLLGEAVTWAAQTAVPAELAAEALEATRAAAYGMEVVAAQSRDTQRTLATTTLGTLRARAAALSDLAGDASPPPSLGYPLPFPVTTPAAARRLAVHVLGGLRASHAAMTSGAVGEASALTSCVEWLAEVEVLAYRWRMPLQAFPGLA
jgi:hypothetical protein